MGGNESIPLPPPPPGFDYMVVMPSQPHKIRVIFGTQNDLSLIRQAVTQNWVLGLRMEKAKLGNNSWTFHLNGQPFWIGTNAVQSASARQTISQILQLLNNSGWELVITTDLSRTGDLTSYFFVRTQVPKQVQFPLLCVSLSSYDKLQLVNAPNDVVQTVKNAIQNVWKKGIQSDGPNGNSYEIKMHGYPWLADGDESAQARFLLAMIITNLAQRQWVLHAAANVKSTADSLFFKYDPEEIPGETAQCFLISLNRTDRLRMMNAPQSIIPVIQQTIMSVWQVMGGIQKEQEYHGSWEFKLSGNPWWSSGNESVMARYLICKIFEALQYQGWRIKASLDVSRKSKDKSVLVFSRSQAKSLPVMCLSFTDTDKIRLINAPQELIGICRDILMAKWYKGINREQQMGTSCPAHEFKLNGNPWWGRLNSCEAIHIRSMLCYVIQAFKSRGWQYLVSADVSAKYHKPKNSPAYPIDVHSWWFAYEPDTQPQPQPPASGYGFYSTTSPSPPSYDEAVK